MNGTRQKRPSINSPLSFGLDGQIEKEGRDQQYETSGLALTLCSMSSNDNSSNVNIQPFPYNDSGSESLIEIRIRRAPDPDAAPTEDDSDSHDSQLRCPKCTIKVKFAVLWEKGSKTKSATVKVTQDDFHQCRVYTVEPVKQC